MLKLYVNGELQGVKEVGKPINATGPMTIGRIKYRGNWTNYFPGMIDELTVWQRALGADSIVKDARLRDPATGKHAVEMVARWNPEDAQSGEVGDSSGYRRRLVLNSGVTVKEEYFDFNGTTGAATVAGPLVDDFGSFTVTAKADIDAEALAKQPNGYKAQVIGQRTSGYSSWGIWFEKTSARRIEEEGKPDDPFRTKYVVKGRWYFGRLSQDGSTASIGTDGVIESGSPVRLTGVHDAQSGTAALYMGDIRQGDPTDFSPLTSTGSLAVGKGFTKGEWGHHFPGRISRLRLWSGAMKDKEQVGHHILGKDY
ncbi:LamG-like jellyroll fold domain-containing protein [Streptomyces sp. NPDC006879]|uniref:LamG-like jellyroll fold domain-containing protein n=1 Tax=Streptomyces sp. NPDC006879 TaxID=3364767 RepID=UPI003676D32E